MVSDEWIREQAAGQVNIELCGRGSNMKSEEMPRGAPKILTRQMVVGFSLALAGLLVFLSWLVTVVFRDRSFAGLFAIDQPVPVQVLIGTGMALVLIALVSIVIANVNQLRGFRVLMAKLRDEIRPRGIDLFVISLAAGFSEELFFRGVLQPLVGIWLTSLLFVVVHVGIPRRKGRVVLGGFVFLMGLAIGVIYEQWGIYSAMTTHFVYDFGFLLAARSYLARDAA